MKGATNSMGKINTCILRIIHNKPNKQIKKKKKKNSCKFGQKKQDYDSNDK